MHQRSSVLLLSLCFLLLSGGCRPAVSGDSTLRATAVGPQSDEPSPQPRPTWSFPTVVPAPTAVQISGRIVFATASGNGSVLSTMNADGSSSTPITFDWGFSHREPAWSPDGQHIAFISNRDQRQGIYIVDVTGANFTGITTLEASYIVHHDPSWSPDGRQIVFAQEDFSEGGSGTGIFIMNADGSNLRRITDISTYDSEPSWSPGGQQIAFKSADYTNRDIYVINIDGTGRKRLTTTPALDYGPIWSPDGEQIAFVSTRDGNPEIYVMDADGSNQRRLTDNLATDGNPTWSPDGRRLAFDSDRDGLFAIFVINADGTYPLRLTDPVTHSYQPDWR